MTLTPTTIEEVQQWVREHPQVLPVGARTKAALIDLSPGVSLLDMTPLAGIVEYEPNEFTFTAQAQTPLRDIQSLLAAQGQYMPFDPPLVEKGATLGGTVAAGLSGAGQYRHGGIRDFLIGIRFVDGQGRIIKGGGKVVKNAAGFDLPKLMIGSLGRLGVIVELTCKVFPQPASRLTLSVTCNDLQDALKRITLLSKTSWEIEALDLEPPNRLMIRLSGNRDAIQTSAKEIERDLACPVQQFQDQQEAAYWNTIRELDWMEDHANLIKIPITLKNIPRLEETLGCLETRRRYSVAGNVAWISWNDTNFLSKLELCLQAEQLSALVIKGTADHAWLGKRSSLFLNRVKKVLDPKQRFPAY